MRETRRNSGARKVAENLTCTEGQVQELFPEGESTEVDDKDSHTMGVCDAGRGPSLSRFVKT